MYIAQRMLRVKGAKGMAWAMDITKVVQAAGVPTSFWVGGPGNVPGTVAWSTIVDSMSSLVTNMDTVAGNGDYLTLLDAGVDHVDSVEVDRLLEIVHGEITEPTEVGQFIGSVVAVADPARSMEALGWATQIADAWTAATGQPVIVVRNAAGDMGEIGWLARAESAAVIDDVNTKIATSSEYGEVMAGGQGLFTSGRQAYARRLM